MSLNFEFVSCSFIDDLLNQNSNPSRVPNSKSNSKSHNSVNAKHQYIHKQMYSSNLTGFILAVVSGAFIGSSFIIKKKGLQRASLNGTPASQLHFFHLSYLLNDAVIFLTNYPLQVSEAMVIFYSLFGGSECLPVSTT